MRKIIASLIGLLLISTSLFAEVGYPKYWSKQGNSVTLTNSSDSVGIGTNQPDTKLTLRDGSLKIITTGGSRAPIILDDYGLSGVSYIIDNGYPSAGLFGIREVATTHFAITGGYVGIGTVVPSGKLHVNVSGTTLPTISPSAVAVFSSTGGAGYGASIDIIGGNTGTSGVNFGDTDVGYIGQISYLHTTNTMAFGTNGSNKVYIDSIGNLGIGTANPVTQLQIRGTGQSTSIYSDSGNQGGALLLQDQSQAVDSGGALLFGGSGPNTWFAGLKALLNDGGGNSTGDLAFLTRATTAATSLTERMRLTRDGYVGIGTSIPQAKFELSDSGVSGPRLRISNKDATSVNSEITFQGASATIASIYVDANGNGGLDLDFHSTGGPINFLTNSLERMRVALDGSVGIGITNPSAKLHVYNGANEDLVATVNNGYAGKAAYIHTNANSNYSQYRSIGVGQEWGIGQFGSTNFYIVDATTSPYTNTPFAVQPGAPSNTLFLNSIGNVGIGTATPTAKFHLLDPSGDQIRMGNINSASSTAVIELNDGGPVQIEGYGTDLKLRTSSTDQVTVTSAGNVGIGTNTPIEKGHIKGGKLKVVDAYDGFSGVTLGATTSDVPMLDFRVSDNSIRGKISMDDINGAAGDRMGIHVQTLSTLPEIVSIYGGGNVGIGTTSPTSTFDVNGDMETTSTGTIYFGDPSTDGTWKIVRSGNDLSFQRRESGSYVEKSKMVA